MCRISLAFLLAVSLNCGVDGRRSHLHPRSSFAQLPDGASLTKLIKSQSREDSDSGRQPKQLRAITHFILAFNPSARLRIPVLTQPGFTHSNGVRDRRKVLKARAGRINALDIKTRRNTNMVGKASKPSKFRPEVFTVLRSQAWSSFFRIGVPTIIAALLGFFYFSSLSLFVRPMLSSEAIAILQDQNQYMQDYVYVVGYMLAIFATNAYGALYGQQEAIYTSLYQEVSVLEALVEQTTLVLYDRPAYMKALECIRDYIQKDFRRSNVTPAELISGRPMKDPLESIMYLTSIGVPSFLYSTVKDLRQARSKRLGAMQRKFPQVGIVLLNLLSLNAILAFPFLGARALDLSETAVSLESYVFGCLVGGLMLVLRVIQELWEGQGGVFNVDATLQELISSLDEEVELRMKQAPLSNSTRPSVLAATRGPPNGMLPSYLNPLVELDENSGTVDVQ